MVLVLFASGVRPGDSASTLLLFYLAVIAYFTFTLFGSVAAIVLSGARTRGVYGQCVHGVLGPKVPVLTGLFGFARVELRMESESERQRLWCFGMPWQLRRLEVGASLGLMRGVWKGKIGRIGWLPFWLPDTNDLTRDPPDGVRKVRREILLRLTKVLGQLEVAFGWREMLKREAPILAIQPFLVVSFIVIAMVGIKGWLLLIPMIGPYLLFGALATAAIVYGLVAADGLLLPPCVRSAVRRFDSTFPAGSPERQAALMVLEEGEAPTPAWEALRKALKT